MTEYLKKSFSVPSWKAPKTCTHGWIDPRGKCVKCGERPDAEPKETPRRVTQYPGYTAYEIDLFRVPEKLRRTFIEGTWETEP